MGLDRGSVFEPSVCPLYLIQKVVPTNPLAILALLHSPLYGNWDQGLGLSTQGD